MRATLMSDGRSSLRVCLAAALTATVVLCMSMGAARADEEDPPTDSPTPTNPGSAAMSTRRTSDASVDRNLLLPTAETLPKGTVAFNSYELFFAGLSYGVTDRLQLSATTMLPITSDVPLMLLASAKYNVYRAPRLLFTLLGNGSIARNDGVTIGGFGGSAIVDGLLDEAGRVVLTGGLLTQFIFGQVNDDTELADGILTALWAGISGRVSKHVKLKGELILPGAYVWAGENRFEMVEEALLAAYGVRFFSSSLAVDLSFIRPMHPDVDTGSLVLGLPWVAFTAAF